MSKSIMYPEAPPPPPPTPPPVPETEPIYIEFGGKKYLGEVKQV